MPAACRIGDLDSDRPPDSMITGSPNTYTNNRKASRVGDLDSDGPPDVKINGSPDTYINNRAAVRVGDKDDDGDSMVSGSPNVYIN